MIDWTEKGLLKGFTSGWCHTEHFLSVSLQVGMVNEADRQTCKTISTKDNNMDKEEVIINQQQEHSKSQAVMEWLLGKFWLLSLNQFVSTFLVAILYI